MDDSVSTVTNEEPVGIEILDQQEQNGLDNVKTDISRTVESEPGRVEEDKSETANQQNNTSDITRPVASPENSKVIESRTVEAMGRVEAVGRVEAMGRVEAVGRVEAGDGNDSSMEACGDGSQDNLLPQGKEYLLVLLPPFGGGCTDSAMAVQGTV